VLGFDFFYSEGVKCSFLSKIIPGMHCETWYCIQLRK